MSMLPIVMPRGSILMHKEKNQRRFYLAPRYCVIENFDAPLSICRRRFVGKETHGTTFWFASTRAKCKLPRRWTEPLHSIERVESGSSILHDQARGEAMGISRRTHRAGDVNTTIIGGDRRLRKCGILCQASPSDTVLVVPLVCVRWLFDINQLTLRSRGE